MRLAVSTGPVDDLRVEIKERFATLNRQIPQSRGRKYPEELRELVRKGARAGIEPPELRRLSGMSETAVKSALAKKSGLSAGVTKSAAPRRLEVVSTATTRRSAAAVVVRLPSGVVIEIDDGAALTPVLLASLAQLEVSHATSR